MDAPLVAGPGTAAGYYDCSYDSSRGRSRTRVEGGEVQEEEEERGCSAAGRDGQQGAAEETKGREQR